LVEIGLNLAAEIRRHVPETSSTRNK